MIYIKLPNCFFFFEVYFESPKMYLNQLNNICNGIHFLACSFTKYMLFYKYFTRFLLRFVLCLSIKGFSKFYELLFPRKRFSRHFRPKLVNQIRAYIVHQSIDSMSGWAAFYNQHSWVMKTFVKSILPFFGQKEYTNIRRFSIIFRQNTIMFSLQKVQKVQFWGKWLHNIYLTKAKSRTLSLFIENTQT